MLLLAIILGFFGIDPGVNFADQAKKFNVSEKILESICRYESDSGRIKHHKNKNGTWDIGLCQNHRKKSKRRPKMPSDIDSVAEAAEELAYWYRAHRKFCVKLYQKTGRCGNISGGKFRGVKNCTRNHHWFHHYNSGFRVLLNDYGNKVYCYMNNNFKKCSKKKWKRMKRNFFRNRN